MCTVAIGSRQSGLSPAIESLLGFRGDEARQSPMKRLLIAVLAALMLTNPAAAVTQDLGTLDASETDFGRGFVRFFGLGSPLGPFTDFYTFDLVQSAVVSGGISAFDLGFVDLSISSVGLTGDMTFSNTAPNNFAFNLPPGHYVLSVDGTFTSNRFLDLGSAFYEGNISAVAVAVPGPIVGAGVPGLVMALGGLLAWRRRRNQAAVA
jgi:hypothetical protein